MHKNVCYYEGKGKLLHESEKRELAVVSGTLYLISDVRSRLMYQKDSYKGW